ncbi:recombinase family protein [Natronomonas sp. F2-12]|uniref:Recombinase family protein n=1 Tax=Natronomonas aquatica TaxID=2841590 RepID=A0A9R1D5B5_9EURY|nr:recombinase family protein [Natronomonas aquatica]MCQ4334214.1 recombinase family protein [Natronomonas aquatica]
MRFDIIPDLNTLYTSELKGYIYAGIPALIISFLCVVYAIGGFKDLYAIIPEDLYYPHIWFILQFLAIGLIAPDEFDGTRFVILGRVSTKDQLPNADFENRLQPIRDHARNERNGTVVKEFTGSESGATMDRESLDEILEMAEADKFDVLAVRDLDRLSRAEPWDTIGYLLKLRETGVNLYEHPEQYYAWDDLNDFQRLSQGMFFSREWYRRISEGRRAGVFKQLEKGRWPLQTHFGYEKDDDRDDGDRNIYIDESKAEILYRIFEIYERTHNIAQTQREINDRFEDQLNNGLTYSRIQTVLSSRLCIGQLTYEGVTKREIPDLVAVPEEMYENVQSILESTSRNDAGKIPEPIVDATTTFGIEYVQSILEQISFRRCKRCGSQLKPYSKTEIFGIPVEKVRCESCDYDGPLLSAKEFREIHQTAPLSCPFCYQAGDFEVEKSQHGLDMTKYECGNCSRQFHTPVGPGKIKRYLNNPDLGVELGGETEQEQDQNSSNGQSQSEKQLTLSEL